MATRKSPRRPGPFLVIFRYTLTGRTVMTLRTPSVPHGPRGSSVQVDSIIAACASAQHMVNNADPPRGEVDISLVAIYFL